MIRPSDSQLTCQGVRNLSGELQDSFRIGGVTIQYFFSCHRELWFYTNFIDPMQDDENIVVGRLIHERSYNQKGTKEVSVGDAKIDVYIGGKTPTILEVKKSSKLIEPVLWQLKFYLWQLKLQGKSIKGEVRIPKEKKVIPVLLTEDDIDELKAAILKIKKIARQSNPPPYEKKPYCKGCAYREICEA